MRMGFARRPGAAGQGLSGCRVPEQARPSSRSPTAKSLGVLIAALAACGLAGCGAQVIESEYAHRIAKERMALLKRQPAPRCEYRTASLEAPGQKTTAGEQPAAASDATASADALRAKLDYERQCYRHAEMIARTRLTSLQAAVSEAARPAYRAEGSGSNQ